MPSYKTRPVSRTPVEFDRHDFGCVDKKGRAIGCVIATNQVVFESIPPGDIGCYYGLEPGVWYRWCPHNTRNSETFGPTQDDHYCRTEEEREVKIKKYLADTQKRFKKMSIA